MTYAITRVRNVDDGSTGWYDSKSHAVRPDSMPAFQLMAFWRTNSTADQEDYRVPPAGYYTAYGYWLPVEDES